MGYAAEKINRIVVLCRTKQFSKWGALRFWYFYYISMFLNEKDVISLPNTSMIFFKKRISAMLCKLGGLDSK